jgi:hypothetical protein
MLRREEIEVAASNVFEHGDLILILTAGLLAGAEFEVIGLDIGPREEPALDRLEQIPRSLHPDPRSSASRMVGR